jgi:transposase
MAIVYVGIDLAKNVFAVLGVNEAGKPAIACPAVARVKPPELFACPPPCTVAMEARSGARHWGRLFAGHGHSVRLIAPKFVTGVGGGVQIRRVSLGASAAKALLE